MGAVSIQREVWQGRQRPSLLVVVGSGPVYHPERDMRRGAVRVFASPHATVVSQSWTLSPSGTLAGTSADVQRISQAKFFGIPERFDNPWHGTRVVVDTQNASDIFCGNDTYGWPKDQDVFAPANRGSAIILQSFTPYDFAHDVIGRGQQARVFGSPEVFFGPQPSFPSNNAVSNFIPYSPATDVRLFTKQHKAFGATETFTQQAQNNWLVSVGSTPFYGPTHRPLRFFKESGEFRRAAPTNQLILNGTQIHAPTYEFLDSRYIIRRSRVRAFTVNAVSVRFEAKSPNETVPLTFDFSQDLPAGVTLTGIPNAVFATAQGSDPQPFFIQKDLVGFDETQTRVVLPVYRGIDGCEYRITITCATTQPDLILTLVGLLPVRADLN